MTPRNPTLEIAMQFQTSMRAGPKLSCACLKYVQGWNRDNKRHLGRIPYRLGKCETGLECAQRGLRGSCVQCFASHESAFHLEFPVIRSKWEQVRQRTSGLEASERVPNCSLVRHGGDRMDGPAISAHRHTGLHHSQGNIPPNSG